MDDLLPEFLAESNEHLEMLDRDLVRFEAEPDDDATLRHIFRVVHTIKGTCGFLNLPRLEALAHAAETLMGRFRDGCPVSAEAVDVVLAALDRIKHIMAELGRNGREPDGGDEDLIGRLEALSREPDPQTAAPRTDAAPARDEDELDELERAFRETAVDDDMAPPAPVIAPPASPPPAAALPDTEASGQPAAASASLRVNVETLERLMTMVSELVLTRNQLLEIARHDQEARFKVPLQRLSHITGELQDAVMKTRMQPISQAWGKLPRIVRDLAQELGKSINLVLEGGETELDRQVLELIRDPLTHIVRNSSDHGIEPPARRVALGKPAAGLIHVTARHEEGAITIRIRDDGGGLDLARIAAKAQARGLAGAEDLARMSEAQVARLIFHPGLSTAEQVSGVSGRGVGMDVVKSNLDAIGGSIDIATAAGQGTTLTLRIPLTLAIISALIVEAGGERFCIPQVAVRELVRLGGNGGVALERLSGAPVIRLRQTLLPVAGLSDVLALDATDTTAGYVVVMQVGGRQFGLGVDAILQTEDIVVKPMAACLAPLRLFAGNTILGDGSVALILEPTQLAASLAGDTQESERPETAEAGAAPAAALTSLLIFRAGEGAPKALPLSVVTRLEDVDASLIETSAGRQVLQYRGELMPIVPVDAAATTKRDGLQPLIVISDGTRSMGLAIDAIVDIAEDALDLMEMTGQGEGLIGRAVVRGRATDILDIGHYLPQAHPDWLLTRARASRPGPRGLLLVEGSDFLRDMLVPVLAAAGHTVTAVADGPAASAQAAGGFGAILLDLDADDAAAQIAAFARGNDAGGPRVIARATFPTPDQIDACRRAGIGDVLPKFDRKALLNALGSDTMPDRSAA